MSLKQVLMLASIWVTGIGPVAAVESEFSAFASLYRQELGELSTCPNKSATRFQLCSAQLRNPGNGPYILHHGKPTESVMVLFHGLSDSPFFFKSIAEALHRQGHNVVVPLLPGHGKKQADADMEDPLLQQRWHQHVEQVIQLAKPLGNSMMLGGFSTGGALSVHHILHHDDDIQGLMLFSGALELSSNAEGMSKIWGIKWLSKVIDGSYQTDGPNPYKYPSVAGYSGLVLMDVIYQIREKLEQGASLDLPIFAAHSRADTTTLFSGIEYLLSFNQSDNTLFAIDESLDVCHADVVVSAPQLLAMNFDKSRVRVDEKCKVPKANPVHPQMLAMMLNFVAMEQSTRQ